MEAQELRLGNYILVDNDLHEDLKDIPMKLWSINHSPNGYSLGVNHIDRSKNNVMPFVAQYIHFLKPIPLTEQWLIDFGFGYSSNHQGYILDAYEVTFWASGLIEFGIYGDVYTQIKYVHQLQNLYFALTGKELSKIDRKKMYSDIEANKIKKIERLKDEYKSGKLKTK